jgi:hypothetical protein
MAMKAGIAVLVSICVAACVAAPRADCHLGERAAISDTLYFGTDRPVSAVTAAEWNEFLATTVTPRFPDGLTVWPAAGQWKAGHAIVHEATYVLSLVHADDDVSENSVREIVRAYKAQFQQEAVLRVRSTTCSSL